MKLKLTRTITILILLTISTLSLHAQQQTDIPKIADVTILKQLLNEQGISNKEVQMEVVFPAGTFLISPSPSLPHIRLHTGG